MKAFSGEDLDSYPEIIWNDSKNLLAYFICHGLMRNNFLYIRTKYNSIIEKGRVFIKPDGESFKDLKQANQEFQNNKSGSPKGSEVIDEIIKKLS